MRVCSTVGGIDNLALTQLVCSLEHARSNETLLSQDCEGMGVSRVAYDVVAQRWVPLYCPKQAEADKW